MLPNYKNSHRCYYCQRRFTEKLFRTKDHIIAITNGGCNNVLNYVPACLDCNVMKSGYSLPEFATLLMKNYRSGSMKGVRPQLHNLFPLMAKRAWKLYNKTRWLHKQFDEHEKSGIQQKFHIKIK